MTDHEPGPVATEIIARLTAALAPSRLTLRNDSDRHRGHAGHDGSGESHFSLDIESAAFVGLSRVQRERLVQRALGELLRAQVHALQVRARVPGEA